MFDEPVSDAHADRTYMFLQYFRRVAVKMLRTMGKDGLEILMQHRR